MGPAQGKKPQPAQQLASLLQRLLRAGKQPQEVEGRRNRRDLAEQDAAAEGLQRQQAHEDGQGNQQLIKEGRIA